MPDISEQKAFMGELTQAETGYVPLSITTGKACANCRWFLKFGDCYIVEDEPEPILATAYCNRWEASAAPVPPMRISCSCAVAHTGRQPQAAQAIIRRRLSGQVRVNNDTTTKPPSFLIVGAGTPFTPLRRPATGPEAACAAVQRVRHVRTRDSGSASAKA